VHSLDDVSATLDCCLTCGTEIHKRFANYFSQSLAKRISKLETLTTTFEQLDAAVKL
jgi:DNA-directed RNA polymerase subunit N (RpoN/RPB10)